MDRISPDDYPGLSRRKFLGTVGAGIAGTFVSRSVADVVERSSTGRPPNIVLIMGDDCSAREFGCYGHPSHKTPVLDSLAQSGVQFKTCWCTPICSPTRAMLMTGRYAYRTGWWHNDQKPKRGEKGANLGTAHRCFAHPLKQSNYATAICGKWQLVGTTKEFGFDEYCLWETTDTGNIGELKKQFSGPIEKEGMSLPGRAARYWHPMIIRNDELLKTNKDDYGPDIFTDFLLDFAKRKKDRPFLAYYPMCLTHMSWDFEKNRNAYLPVPERDGEGRKTGKKIPGTLKSNVEYADYIVGRIVRGLEDLGLRNNTIVIFTCDNGTSGYGKSNPKEERGPRVPLIVNCPGLVKPLGAVDALASHVDMFATLCDITGATPPAGYEHDGHCLAPLLLGRPFVERQWIHSYFKDKRWLRDKRWLLDGDGQLYDCGNDRNERGYRNVANSREPEVLQARERFAAILRQLETNSAVPTRDGA